jgi:acetyltransferase-like isoleucine patch superfamily enzyme
VFRTALQVLAFLFPKPINIWLHRIAGAKINKYVAIQPCVLILAKSITIDNGAVVKFGTMINVRSFSLGKKSSIGFFTLVNGVSDFIIEDACVIGARSMINCDKPVIFRYYSGNGPGCFIYTHGSFLPVTEGYNAVFSPVEIKEKVWIQMNCKIGPGVTIGEGSVILPGSVVLENVERRRMVVGDPAKLLNVPLLIQPKSPEKLVDFAKEILLDYCNWSNGKKGTNMEIRENTLIIKHKRKTLTVAIDELGDIVLLTQKGLKGEGIYFNIADLTTDDSRNRVKLDFEKFLRLHYGLVFLS